MPKRKNSKFANVNANIVSAFLPNENPDVDLSKLSEGSHVKIVCQCPQCKTKWICEIRKNKDKISCPNCASKRRSSSNMRVKTNESNTLKLLFPEIAKEWDFDKNDEWLTPENISAQSSKKVFWKCPLEHSYKATVTNRTRNHSGCPYCSGQKVLVGFNDLKTVAPQLANEWSPKNSIQPTEVTAHSNKKVYWVCSLGHDDYLMSVKQRSNNQGCPVCALQSQTSFPEQAILFYIKKVFPNAIGRYKYQNQEIDIYIPSLNIGIEYNGNYYHKSKEHKDLEKKKFFKDNGIKLLVVDEYKNESDKRVSDFYLNERYSMRELNDLISDILFKLDPDTTCEIRCEQDAIEIKQQYINQLAKNSIGEMKPELIKEWDHIKNGSITPFMVSYGSNQKYYWKCPVCGNSYCASPKHRIHGTECPFCKHKMLKAGTNDLASVYPELLNKWDYNRNEIEPSQVLAAGGKEYYWKCEKGHSYLSNIRSEQKRKLCPVCSGKKVIAGVNDLFSQNQKAAVSWDYELNTIDPRILYYRNQSLPIHWICKKCGFRWISTAKEYRRCPNCAKMHAKLNVYLYPSMSFYGTFDSAEEFCNHIGIDIKKQRGNISSVCNRKQQTLLHKYVLRHPDNDEFCCPE